MRLGPKITKRGPQTSAAGGRAASHSRGRPFLIAVGLLGIGLTLLMVYIAFNAPNSIPGRSYYTVEAAFTNADNVTPHSQVRLGGKLVGQVLDPRVEDGIAVVDLQLDPKYGPLKSDSRVEVRPRSPVGVRYVEVEPGTSGTELDDGERIPARQTNSTTPLDEVLATFDPATKASTQVMMRSLGQGFAGRGSELNDAIGDGVKTLRGTDEVLGSINRRKGATENLIRGGASAASAVDPVRRTLGRGFEVQARALRPFSDRRESLGNILEQAPPTLSALRTQLPAVDGLVGNVRGFAANMRPGLEAAPTAFRRLSAMFDASRPGLSDAQKTVSLARRAVDPTLDLLNTVRPVLPRIETALEDATPLATRLGAHGCDIITWGTNWSKMMQYGNDSGGGVLRFSLVTPTAESVIGAGPALKDSALYPVSSNPYPTPCVAGTERLADR